MAEIEENEHVQKFRSILIYDFRKIDFQFVRLKYTLLP